MAPKTHTQKASSPSSENSEAEKGDGKGNGKKEHVRKKTWRPKTKTGCITCRIRRVKCDEAKPSCQRCISTGRKCDGYTQLAQTGQSYAVVYAAPKTLTSVPGLDLNSTAEQEAFHFFKHRTSNEMPGFFDHSFWQFEILQASHTLPAIRHGLIAMAAMHRKFIDGRMPVVPDDTSDKQIQFALHQSTLAIQELRKSSAGRSLSDSIDTMTACILFYCLACFQGHQSVAMTHLRNGLRILRQVDESLATGQKANEHPISLDTLRTMFVTMDMQARGIMADDDLRVWEPQPRRNFNLPTSFKTFAQARYYFEASFNDMLTFMQGLDIEPPTGPDANEFIIGQYKRYQQEFDTMSDCLDEFLSQLSHVTNQEDRESVLGIRMFREQVKVYLRVFKGFSGDKHVREFHWHLDEHEMEILVDLASELLNAPKDLTIPAGAVPQDYYTSPADLDHVSQLEITTSSRPVFTSNSGLLSGLWLVCSRAKSSALRRRAIAMMLKYPRREGVWDGVVAGRIAWEVLVLEETAFEGELGARQGRVEARSDYIPEMNKVRSVEINYVGMRVMELQIRSVKQYEAGRPGWKRHIAW